MALVDERNQDDQSDVIEDSQEGSEKPVAGDTGVDKAENGSEEESDEEESDDEESDDDRQGFPDSLDSSPVHG